MPATEADTEYKKKKLESNISDEVINWCCIFYINISVLQLYSALQKLQQSDSSL
jgi:hypothetical protein